MPCSTKIYSIKGTLVTQPAIPFLADRTQEGKEAREEEGGRERARKNDLLRHNGRKRGMWELAFSTRRCERAFWVTRF